MNSMMLNAACSMTPAQVRLACERLLMWLPTGAVALLGDPVPELEHALRQCGVQTQPTTVGAVAGVLFFSHTEAGQSLARLQQAVSGMAGPVCLVVTGQAALQSPRADWEAAVIGLEWRKHPLNECVAPYGELDAVTGLLMVAFERVPKAATAAYPLQALVAERDLHTDMTREPGRRSDAHMTRYAQASQFIRAGDRVIDVACGLGYGSYQLAHQSGAASFVGLDASEYAIDYANLNFAAVSPVPMRFVVGDAQALTDMADASADFAVSVETLEHLPEPDRLLAELHRVLAPHGRVYASVPNDWADETGEDPNPFHFHVYDWPRLVAQFTRNGFVIEKAWMQDAGGGQKRHLAARSILEFDPRIGPSCDGEWLLVLACKTGSQASDNPAEWSGLVEQVVQGSDRTGGTVLSSLAGSSDPVIKVRASALLALLAHADGAPAARQYWSDVAEAAREALADAPESAQMASMLHLALSQLADDRSTMPGTLHRLRVAHPDALAFVLGACHRSSADRDDRAIMAGPVDGAERIHLGANQVRELLEAKQWLDGQYGQHLMRIAELEAHVVQLEEARQWLDGQYHSLTAEIQRLSSKNGHEQ